MTVSDLISYLEEFDGDMEVRIASQPNYPFEYELSGVWEDENEDSQYAGMVYLVEGTQIGYFTRKAWND